MRVAGLASRPKHGTTYLITSLLSACYFAPIFPRCKRSVRQAAWRVPNQQVNHASPRWTSFALSPARFRAWPGVLRNGLRLSFTVGAPVIQKFFILVAAKRKRLQSLTQVARELLVRPCGFQVVVLGWGASLSFIRRFVITTIWVPVPGPLEKRMCAQLRLVV